jgi:thiol-disulfide isomerase/thioredoxin
MKTAITTTLLILFFTITSTAQNKQMWAKSVINQQAPELQVEKWISDRPDTSGKFVLIDFWATWCGPCLQGIPEMNKFQKEFKDDLIVIGLSNESAQKVKKHRKPNIEYYSAIDTQRRTNNALEVSGIPHCILIDPEGVVRWEGFPALAGEELTSQVINDIIKKYND